MDTLHQVITPGIKEIDNSTNRVVLAGKIVNKYDTNKQGRPNRICVLTIAITESQGSGYVANYPSIVVFRDKDTGASIVDDFFRNDWVRAEGYLSSSAKSRQKKDTYRMQQIVIDKMEKLEPTYPEAIGENKGRPHHETFNRTVLMGEVRSINKITENVTNLGIDAINNGVHNIITVNSFGSLAHTVANDISVGSTIRIDGKISTSVKEADGRKVHYQNVVARNIEVINKAEAKLEA